MLWVPLTCSGQAQLCPPSSCPAPILGALPLRLDLKQDQPHFYHPPRHQETTQEASRGEELATCAHTTDIPSRQQHPISTAPHATEEPQPQGAAMLYSCWRALRPQMWQRRHHSTSAELFPNLLSPAADPASASNTLRPCSNKEGTCLTQTH